MSLTIAQSTKTQFAHSFTHEFIPRISLAKSRFHPANRGDSTSPVTSLRASDPPAGDKMSSGPHTHRGLPPPSAMALPDPRRDGPTPMSQPLNQPSSQPLGQTLNQPLGAMPAPPGQWQGQEEPMRNWLLAKAEEDKRKQEEQKTQQESLRLEQRKIEQNMLRESLQGGVPPSMVPMIYAGIGGANLVNVSLDWLHQYANQLQAAQQQIQQASPEMHRDQSRLAATQQAGYPVSQPTVQQVLPSQPTDQAQPASLGPLQTTFNAYQPVHGRQSQTSAPRSATHTQLPRLTTNEMFAHQPPQPGAAGAHPLQQSQTIQQDQPSSSPSIYFHHWVPPNETKGGNNPQTPASKGEPHSAHPSVPESEYRDSPRKRKAAGGHQANPPPSTAPQYTSPSFSTSSSASGRKGGHHTRSRSNISAGRDTDSRPDSRPDSRREDPQSALSKHTDSGHPSNPEEYTFQRPPSRMKEETPASMEEQAARHREFPNPELA